MSKQFSIERKIRDLKLGEFFQVNNEKERQLACRSAKTLRAAGVIDFQIATRKNGTKFKVVAI